MSWLSRLFGREEPKPVPETLIYCVPQSIACAWSWSALRKTNVRIAVQNLESGAGHAQAQALIDGRWQPLNMKWTAKGPVTFPGKAQFDIEPYRYLTLREWIDEQITWTD